MGIPACHTADPMWCGCQTNPPSQPSLSCLHQEWLPPGLALTQAAVQSRAAAALNSSQWYSVKDEGKEQG